MSVNCAAIPSELFESELFGHDAGAFTSAKGSRMGLLEEAGEGVLFLDEVGELPLPLQAKLLRVLETREFRRVGSGRVRRFQGRVVSATNRNLGEASAEAFRSDLYFRIAGHTIRTPALATRSSDIPLLANHFCQEFRQRYQAPTAQITPAAMQALVEFDWPGNVRQLRAVIHNGLITDPNHAVGVDLVDELLRRRPRRVVRQVSGTIDRQQTLPDMEREVIETAYRSSGENLTRAAEMLGIPRTTLRDRLKRYGLR